MSLNRAYFEITVLCKGSPDAEEGWYFLLAKQRPMQATFMVLHRRPSASAFYATFPRDGPRPLPCRHVTCWNYLPARQKLEKDLDIDDDVDDIFVFRDARFVEDFVVTPHAPEPFEAFIRRHPYY